MLPLIGVVWVPIVTSLPLVAGAVGLAMVFEMVTATAGTRKLRIALTAQISIIDWRDALLDDL